MNSRRGIGRRGKRKIKILLRFLEDDRRDGIDMAQTPKKCRAGKAHRRRSSKPKTRERRRREKKKERCLGDRARAAAKRTSMEGVAIRPVLSATRAASKAAEASSGEQKKGLTGRKAREGREHAGYSV